MSFYISSDFINKWKELEESLNTEGYNPEKFNYIIVYPHHYLNYIFYKMVLTDIILLFEKYGKDYYKYPVLVETDLRMFKNGYWWGR